MKTIPDMRLQNDNDNGAESVTTATLTHTAGRCNESV